MSSGLGSFQFVGYLNSRQYVSPPVLIPLLSILAQTLLSPASNCPVPLDCCCLASLLYCSQLLSVHLKY
ncbi:MAG: hypothetical protein LBC61_00510, partial [Candidatus Peribacteria bacterium]|nr:hypothetical protein [Candidatus Peribacteria bacterium]